MLWWSIAVIVLGAFLAIRHLRKRKIKEVVFASLPRSEAVTGPEILITGGLGFIGGAIAQELLRRGNCAVRIFDMMLPLESKRDPRITYMQGNVTNKEHVMRAVKDVDSVIHVAGIIPTVLTIVADVRRVNVEGTRNIIEGRVCNIQYNNDEQLARHMACDVFCSPALPQCCLMLIHLCSWIWMRTLPIHANMSTCTQRQRRQPSGSSLKQIAPRWLLVPYGRLLYSGLVTRYVTPALFEVTDMVDRDALISTWRVKMCGTLATASISWTGYLWRYAQQ